MTCCFNLPGAATTAAPDGIVFVAFGDEKADGVVVVVVDGEPDSARTTTWCRPDPCSTAPKQACKTKAPRGASQRAVECRVNG